MIESALTGLYKLVYTSLFRMVACVVMMLYLDWLLGLIVTAITVVLDGKNI